MDMSQGRESIHLLFVSRENLARIVKFIAPDLVLVPRNRLTEIAGEMLPVVEAVAHEKPK